MKTNEGKSLSVKEFCRITGVTYKTFLYRISHGLSTKEAIFLPSFEVRSRKLKFHTEKQENTREYILSLIRYEKDTGDFYWLSNAPGKVFNKKAGYMNPSGYVRIGINSNWYLAHRLAWFIEYNEWPEDEIDHINHNRSDNRISNLRKVSRAENAKNKKIPKNSSSGVMGVSKSGNKWVSQIYQKKKKIYLGTFDTIEEAKSTRLVAQKNLCFHKNHGIKNENQ